MTTSSEAAAIIARAKKFQAAPLIPPQHEAFRSKNSRQSAAPKAMLTPSSAEPRIVGTAIRAYSTSAKRKSATIDVAYPTSVHQNRTLNLSAGAAFSLKLNDATDAPAEFANGYLVYRAAMRTGAHVIVRPSDDGFEDYFLFEKRPDVSRVEYDLTLSPAVAGLRLISNILELVGADGSPLAHASPPFLVDSAGKRTKAKISIAGCAFDQSTQPTWKRKPTPPGATECRISMAWDDRSVEYPALLDPTWETAQAMPVVPKYYNSEVLAGRSPQQIVVFNLYDDSGFDNSTLFFDVDSATWSAGPPTVLTRVNGSSVSFNNDNTNNGARVFVSGGYAMGANGFALTASTETLSVGANGQWAWQSSSPMQLARYSHTATAIPTATGAQVLLAGGIGEGSSGCDGGATSSTAELYDTSTGAFVSPAPPNLPAPVFAGTAALSSDHQAVIIMGGYNGAVDEPSRNCTGSSQVFAFRGGQWLTLPSLPSYRIAPLITQLNDGRFLVAGGSGYTDATQQTCEQKTDTQIFTYSATAPYGSWGTADPLPSASDGRLVTLSNGAVLFGPIASVSCDGFPSPTTQVELFDPQSGHWSRTTDTAQPHRYGALSSVTKSTGDHEVVLFGGWAAFDPSTYSTTYADKTEILTLTQNGQPCTVGTECTTGICLSGFCQPPGFPISIDATALSNKGLAITGYATTPIDTTQARTVNLAAGTYTLQPYTGLNSIATFTVDGGGVIQYSPALEGLLNGAGSTSLKVNGRTITVDATPLAQPQLALLAYHYQGGAEVDRLPFANSPPVSFTLLPLVDFGYQFDVDGNHVAGFTFNLDPNGNVLVPAEDLVLARGSGGTLLRLGGAHVSVTVPTGLGSAVLGGDVTIPEGTTTNLQLLPYANGATIPLTVGGQTTTLTVNSSGYLDGDPLLLYALQLQGDGAPMCDAQNTQAEASGWNLTPINGCAGPSQQTATGYVDAPTINPTVTARIRGAARPPSMLPRNRRSAGGDPVLGDGEFLIDRTDASLAGLGVHYEFHRSYRSGNETDGPLSPGWDHNYDQRILGQVIGNPQSPNFDPTLFGDEIATNCDGTVQYQDGTGSVLLFKQSRWAFDANGIVQYFTGPTEDFSLEFHLSFVSPQSTVWRLVRNDGQVTTFDRAGFLWTIADPAGNSLTFGWARATPPAPPSGVDCPAIGYSTQACSNWLYGLMKNPIGQRRRLVSVTDPARVVYYVYSQTNTELIYPNDRLACISLSNNCATNVLASFHYDTTGARLWTVMHGPPTATPFETYHYHDVVSDSPYCRPSAELPGYCHRLCDDPVTGQCGNLGYTASVLAKCMNQYCVDFSQCDSLVDPQMIRRGSALNAPSICCVYQPPGNDLCKQFLWNDSRPEPNCIDGCENQYQCTTTTQLPPLGYVTQAAYAAGVGSELTNDITDVFDSQGNLVVHNVYGEDRTLVDFEKVKTQTLSSASSDNTITFEYHDLDIEAHGAPVYNNSTGYTQWGGTYSSADPTVNQYSRYTSVLDICPAVCPGGGTGCATFNYNPPVEYVAGFQEQGSRPTVFATVIHDLHGINRIQYLDRDFYVMKEVTLNTGEVTEYNYTGGGIIPGGLLRGIQAQSGVRTCLERDSEGRVTQSSLLAAPGYTGPSVPKVTTYAYYPNGQLRAKGQLQDETHDVFGVPTHTHYDRDPATTLVTHIVQDVDTNAGVTTTVHTDFGYGGANVSAGSVNETPTSITYPNLRTDTFSDFDPTLGGPRTIVIDSTSATPEHRYVTYDSLFGRIVEQGEVNRFAQHFGYTDTNDVWRLTYTGHSLASNGSNRSWVDTTITSHVVNGETIIDSLAGPLRTTNFANVGQFPTEKDLVATVAPPGSSLPDPQTTCYNYAPDGRLDATVLPEGNGVKYTYSYLTTGTSVSIQKGFGVDTSGDWAANCRGKAAPQHDPGLSLPATRSFRPGGFIDKEVDENLVARQYATDGFGRVISIASIPNPARPDDTPATLQLGYDVAGHMIWQALRTPGAAYGKPTLPDSSVLAYSEFDYDLLGGVKEERRYALEASPVEVLTKRTRRDYVAGTVTTTDRGVDTTITHDGRGRVLSTLLPMPGATSSVIHGLGVDTVTIHTNTSYGNVVREYDYNTRGLLTDVKTADAVPKLLYHADYDDDGNQTTETRAGLGPVNWVYDSFDRLVTETRTISASPTVTATSNYKYDLNNRLKQYCDAQNYNPATGACTSMWTMTFTGGDAPLNISDPQHTLVGAYSYSSDANWPRTLATTEQEPNGRVTSFAYDSQARPLDIYSGDCGTTRDLWSCPGPLTSQRHMTYDARGNVIQVDAPSQRPSEPRPSVYFTYDSLGRPLHDQVGVDSLVEHTYLDQGRSVQTTVTYGGTAATMIHRYDTMGRLHTVELTGQTTPLATYAYGTGIGGPITLTYSNGAVAGFNYDDKLRQTGIEVNFGSTFVASFKEAFGSDSIPRLREHKIGTHEPTTDVFQVDLDGRITGENQQLTGITWPTGEVNNGDSVVADNIQKAGTAWRGYDLDNIGNIVKRRMQSSTLMHTIDKLGRLTALDGVTVDSVDYDNIEGVENGFPQFAFNAFAGTVGSATVGAATTTYFYDALDRRSSEHRSADNSDHVYVWDGHQLVGHGTPTEVTLDVPGDDIDAHIVSIDQMGTGSQWFYHQGPDQSVLAVTGSAGVVEAYAYSAFGELSMFDGAGNSKSTSAFDNIFQFQGQVFDKATSTYSMRARQYQPAWGSFLSPDPISVGGGPSLYAFAGSRPLQSRDPSGMLSVAPNGYHGSKWMSLPVFGFQVFGDGILEVLALSDWSNRPGWDPSAPSGVGRGSFTVAGDNLKGLYNDRNDDGQTDAERISYLNAWRVAHGLQEGATVDGGNTATSPISGPFDPRLPANWMWTGSWLPGMGAASNNALLAGATGLRAVAGVLHLPIAAAKALGASDESINSSMFALMMLGPGEIELLSQGLGELAGVLARSVPGLDEAGALGAGGSRVLNIGSGNKPVAGAVNLDIFAGRGVNVIGDARALPFEAGSFGRVVAQRIPSMLASDPRVASEIFRVLANGGTAQLTSVTPFGPGVIQTFIDAGFSSVQANGGLLNLVK
jgi:RHS repeat-associated protein